MKYTKENWIAENAVTSMGMRVACPECGVTEFYSPREARNPKGGKETRKYRACKFCGFWQEVGGRPYWCNMYYHVCKGTGAWDWKPPSWIKGECKICGGTVEEKRWPVDDPKHPFHKLRKMFARTRRGM